ncbi:NAD(P)H-dependent glycerol-3-phosphate dehydrogenase [Paracoccus pacificus]|uniref:Glycerol-3-phosphate dehydrogenase [NAD(P)+] n=1 Tax=Paracoccus pacificus TaxID=1463598 RepID=A0ABW4R2R5_9RHOB
MTSGAPIGILGAGAFGGALAVALAARGPVTLWGRDLRPGQRALPRLRDVDLPPAVTTTDRIEDALDAIVLLALPAQALSGFLSQHAALLDGRALVACAKGIDLNSGLGPVEVIAAACPNATPAVLTGPSFAHDIARGLPTALTLACADEAQAIALQAALSTPVLRVYRTTDVIGAELGGALKNVIAIAAGAAIGAGFGDSARAAIITRGFAEMTRLAVSRGARADTLTGLSGLGDLVLTCTSEGSRNFRFGLALGAGEPFDPAITVEGVATASAAAALARAEGLDLPITAAVSDLCQGRATIQTALAALLARPLKEE